MKQIFKNLITHKHAIIWTVCYTFIIWVILKYLFNFDIFVGANWARLIHAELHGFAGFVFGILLLAALPLYMATMTIIIRTRAPLFTPTVPKQISKLFAQPPMPSETDDKKASAPQNDASNSDGKVPTDETDATPAAPNVWPQQMPAELHRAFQRARNSIAQNTNTPKPLATKDNSGTPMPAMDDTKQTSTQKISSDITPSNPTVAPAYTHDHTPARPSTMTPAPTDGDTNDTIGVLPVPSDFDIQPDTINANIPMSAPTFKTIDFDTPSTPNPSPAPHAPDTTNDTDDTENSAIIEWLTSKGRKYHRDGNLIISDNMAIASHCDDRFWVTDGDDWFAPGTSRPSPIKELKSAAQNGHTPILYLGAKNIMDLDNMIKKWTDDGIRVIQSPSDLN